LRTVLANSVVIFGSCWLGKASPVVDGRNMRRSAERDCD
jgi:hypothetical protein